MTDFVRGQIKEWMGEAQGNEDITQKIAILKAKGLPRRQCERKQLQAFIQATEIAFPTLEEKVLHIHSLFIALAATIHSSAKNHKKDLGLGLQKIQSKAQYLEHFSTYESADTWCKSLSLSSGDIYNDFSWNGAAKDFAPQTLKLEAYARKHSNAFPMDVNSFSKSISGKVLLVGGKLFSLMTIATFSELGLVKKDCSFRHYLPKTFTKTSGSLKLYSKCIQREATSEEFRQHILNMLEDLDSWITASDVENIYCKAWVGGL